MKKKKALQNRIDWIDVYGAREHNLKNITVSIPKNTLTIITGPSGSGKSSLALDILFAEGKRRYLESLSSYARQFLGVSKKPEVDRIDGLCPAIAIEQKTVGSNPRSTVGTITEIYDYLRILFARIGTRFCPDCHSQIQSRTSDEIVALLSHNFDGAMITVSAPIAIRKKGEFAHELAKLFSQGYYRFKIDGTVYKFKSIDDIKAIQLKKTQTHSIDVILDALELSRDESARLEESISTAFRMAQGNCKITHEGNESIYSSQHVCVHCMQSIPDLEPRFFSFNSPVGACRGCQGLGVINEWSFEDEASSWKADYPEFFAQKYAKERVCQDCNGKRLNKYALSVLVGGKDIYQMSDLSIKDLLDFFASFVMTDVQQEIVRDLIIEISAKLRFISNVGLSYLTLNRTARTLSGGEGQRIRLAKQISLALSGVLYILDEPSIGLHQRDNDRLIETLKTLRDGDNTVVVVEHDIDTIIQSDYVIDMGPAAGALGGMVTAVGSPQELAKNPHSLTGAYISGKRSIAQPVILRKPQGFVVMHDVAKNNLKNITVAIPLGVLCGISGVSGSGKSTLIMDQLVSEIKREFAGGFKRVRSATIPVQKNFKGADSIESMVVIDQSPIGRTPRSNPATYLGVFDDIRKLFASLPESNARGYSVGRFSFNVAGGRCGNCSGDGTIKVEMHFLPEVIIVCRECNGMRYNKETLSIVYKNKSIADVLDMTAHEALQFFQNHKSIAKRLQLLCDVGLDYLKLGQASTTLSGGEAQRIKLVDELVKREQHTLYVLDEPTTGLHNSDIEKLMMVLHRLVDKNNSMIIIEHNIDVLRSVDYLIDLGPEGGQEGGFIIAQGTPQEVANSPGSYTGFYLKKVMS